MKLPNWVRITWFIVLVITLSIFLILRYQAFIAGTVTAVDVVAFAVWLALVLAPLFQEISLFGLTFKGIVQDATEEIKREIADVRTDVRATISSQNRLNATFHNNVAAPPPDEQLKASGDRIKEALEPDLEEKGVDVEQLDQTIPVDENTVYMFKARYNVEKEVKRVFEERIGYNGIRKNRMSIVGMTKALVKEGIIDGQVAHAIQEFYAVTSEAVHARGTSDIQINYVRDVGPWILADLRAL